MKKFYAALAAILIFNSIPNFAFADNGIAKIDDHYFSIEADTDTSSKPAEFGTTAADGRVWVDKSVSGNLTDADFDVTLSAMAQEYVYSREEMANMETTNAADVLFILDFSTSMSESMKTSDSGGSTTRFAAMTEAVNLAMQQIMSANKKNRVMICWYAGTNTTKYGTVVPLGSYCTENGGKEVTNEKYFELSSDGRTFQTVSTFKEVGGASVSYSKTRDSGTRSQLGIAACTELFINATQTSADLGGIKRTPFVLYMTDGYATGASTSWEKDSSVLSTFDVDGADGSTHSPDNSKDKQVAALTLLTAAVSKDSIVAHYNALDTSAGYDGISDLTWFNVGLAVDAVTDATKARGIQIMLNPTYAAVSTDKADNKTVYDWLQTYTNDDSNAYHVAYRPTGSSTDRYIYTNEGYVTYAKTGDVLNTAFNKLGELVARLTAGTVLPVTNTTSSASADDVFITFKDTIGDGTEIAKNADNTFNFTLTLNGAQYPSTKNLTTGRYDFSDGTKTLKSFATTEDDGKTITWAINASELPIIRFSNRFEPGTVSTFDGTVYANPEAEPIRLSFTVSPTADALSGAGAGTRYVYSNKWENLAKGPDTGTTSASFIPKTTNSYYYDQSLSADNQLLETPVEKGISDNVTQTAAYVSYPSWDGSTYSLSLGNNGRAKQVKAVTVEKKWSDTWENHKTDSVIVAVYQNDVLCDTLTLDYSNQSIDKAYDLYDADGKTYTYTVKEVLDAKDVEEGEMYGDYISHYSTSTKDGIDTFTIENSYKIKPEDIDITKTAAAVAEAGGQFTYTISVKNTREYETAKDIKVTDTIPAGLEILSISAAAEDSVNQVGNQITWVVKSLAGKRTASMDVTVKVPDTAVAEEYINKAKLISVEGQDSDRETDEIKTDVRTFTVTKKWKNSDGSADTDLVMKSPVTVYLKQNGAVVGSGVKLDNTNAWTYTWKNIPISPLNGTPYDYTVDEDPVEGYSPAVVYDETTKEDCGYMEATVTNTLKTVNVVYHYTGDVIPEGMTPPAGGTYDYGTAYNAEAKQSKDYYSFEGWCTDEGCTAEFTDGTELNDVSAPSGTLDLYGRWAKKTVEIDTVAPPDGVGPSIVYPVKKYINEGEYADLPELTDPNGEYLFDGYYTDEDQSIPFVDKIITEDDVVDGKLTLYPKWVRAVNVSYEFLGIIPDGAVLPTSDAIKPGTVYTPKTPAAVDGFEFDGWYLDDTLLIPYAPAGLVNDTKLYGQWNPAGNFTVDKDVLYNGTSVKGQQIHANDTVGYVINVRNNNTTASTDISFVDRIPGDMIVDETSISHGGVYDQFNRTIIWNLTLAANESARLTFNATVPPSISAVSYYDNTAYVATVNGEPFDGPGSEFNNPGSATFSAMPVKVMNISKAWSDRWDSHITSSAAVNLYADGALIRTLPFTYYSQAYVLTLDAVDAFGNEIDYVFKEVSIDNPVIDLPSGEMNGDYRYTSTIIPEGQNVTVNLDNTYQIKPEDLTIEKLAPSIAPAGDYFTYTIQVTNNRTYETANNIEVQDLLPQGVTYATANVSPDDTFTYNDALCTWTIANLGPGQTAVLDIVVYVDAGTTVAEYENTAKIVSIGGSTCTERESPTAVTTVRNFTVKKLWYDVFGNEITDTSYMPPVTVSLMQNGTAYGAPVELASAENYYYRWDLLPLFDDFGTPYIYTVTEMPVEGYTSSIVYAKEMYGDTEYDTAAVISNAVKKITVSYEYAGPIVPPGAVPPATETVDYGTSYISVPQSYCEGYIFNGWYVDKELTVPYSDGTVLNDVTVPSGTMPLYGKWSKDPAYDNYTVKIVKAFGSTLGRAYYRMSPYEAWIEVTDPVYVTVKPGTTIYYMMVPNKGNYNHPYVYNISSGSFYAPVVFDKEFETSIYENTEVRLNFSTGVPTGDINLGAYVLALMISVGATAIIAYEIKRKKITK